MGLGRLGLITVVNNRTLCVWIIRGGCKPNALVKWVTFMPCHFHTSVSSFRMFGHMLCYLISTLITNNAGVGFPFKNLIESVEVLRIALMIVSKRLWWMW